MGVEFLISHTFQRKRYISIARTGIYALGLFAETMHAISFTIMMSETRCGTFYTKMGLVDFTL